MLILIKELMKFVKNIKNMFLFQDLASTIIPILERKMFLEVELPAVMQIIKIIKIIIPQIDNFIKPTQIASQVENILKSHNFSNIHKEKKIINKFR